MKQINFKGH